MPATSATWSPARPSTTAAQVWGGGYDPNDPESKIRAWGCDRILSGDTITEQFIHALDVATWIVDAAP